MAIRSRWITQFQELPENSKFHNQVREIFADSSFFKLLHCYQEVPVSDLCEDYPSNRHRFDWYIDELECVIELHGRQHYEQVNYGNISYDQAAKNFKGIRTRDKQKKQAALGAGLGYIEISYKYYNKLSDEILKNLILYNMETDHES